jgi:hypothetical protein
MAKKKTTLVKLPKSWKGKEHFLFLRGLEQTLSRGPQLYVEETDRRRAWYRDNYHRFPDLMLVGCFAYLEGLFGEGWIGKHGGPYKRSLYTLRLIRNVVVHKNCRLSGHRQFRPHEINASKGRPANVPAYVRRYAAAVEEGRIKYQNGSPIPVIFTVSWGVVKLNNNAITTLRIISRDVLERSGKMKPPKSRPSPGVSR